MLVLTVLKRSFKDFLADEAPVRAAALAYYTVFALPPLLVLLIMVAGVVWDPRDVQQAMESQFASIVGAEGGKVVHGMIAAVDQPGGRSVVKTILGIAGLIFGATGAFLQLQGALNRAWDVKPDPKAGGFRNFVTKRLLSLGMILGVAFLVAVSLALSAVLSLLGDKLGSGFPDGILAAANVVLSFVVLTALFAAIFKVLPDATIAWKDVMAGAVMTSLLFVAGKFAIGFYLGRSSPGEAFGAAGSLAVVLIWIYYAGMILLLGAELTQAWARSRGRDVAPERGAVRIEPGKSASAAAPEKSSRNAHPVTLTQGDHTMNRDLAPRGSAAIAPTNGSGNGLADEQSVGELVKALSTDTSHLLRQEINLAKAELMESATHVTKGATKVGIAAGIAIPGLLAFGAFLIIALGDLLNGNYWLSALIVSLAMLGAAAVMAKKGIADFGKASFVPEETVGTLREDAEWAKTESGNFKRAFTAPASRTH